ncbi:MAG: transcription antitermination factor NusB [Clostridia bacterium]|nr:transcription antitermination factor NusB [Clostridia bacterium]
MRSLAREIVFKTLYSKLFNNDNEELFTILKKENNLSKDDSDFADKLLEYSLSDTEKYLNKISELSIGFKINRILSLDKCALIIGMAELDRFDTPIAVAINEAVNLSSKYSTEKSTNFVNGILAEYVKGK